MKIPNSKLEKKDTMKVAFKTNNLHFPLTHSTLKVKFNFGAQILTVTVLWLILKSMGVLR